MNRMLSLFIGIFATFAFAWVGLIVIPYFQLGHLQPFETEDGDVFPPPLSGLAQYGRKVYAANGCVYCHSQQIRGGSSDIARGWGVRRTVARDYMNDRPVLLGSMRIGPDLTNIGKRQPSAEWHHLHLYQPQVVSPGSTMPPFRFLYKKQKIVGEPSSSALKLKGSDAPEAGYEIIPTREAKALVAYLLSLDRTYSLPEDPVQ